MRPRPTERILVVAAVSAALLLGGCSSKQADTSGPLPSSNLKPSADEFCSLVAQFQAGPEQDLVSSRDIAQVRKGAHELAPVVARLAIIAPKAIHADMATVAASWTRLTEEADRARSVRAFTAATEARSAASVKASAAVGSWTQKHC